VPTPSQCRRYGAVLPHSEPPVRLFALRLEKWCGASRRPARRARQSPAHSMTQRVRQIGRGFRPDDAKAGARSDDERKARLIATRHLRHCGAGIGPKWVNGDSFATSAVSPLYPSKQTFGKASGTVVLCQTPTSVVGRPTQHFSPYPRSLRLTAGIMSVRTTRRAPVRPASQAPTDSP
jgi:hypothetical protein